MKIVKQLKGVLSVIALLAASHALAQKPQPFSADYSTAQADGKHTTAGKIYFSPPKMRLDATNNEREFTALIDMSSHTVDMIMPAQHMYMELNMDQAGPMAAHMPKVPSSFDPNHPCMADETCSKEGTETINGRLCDKWETKGPKGTRTAWIDHKLLFPVRSVSASGNTFELTNIKEGMPDPALFIVPAGYQKIDMGMIGGKHP